MLHPEELEFLCEVPLQKRPERCGRPACNAVLEWQPDLADDCFRGRTMCKLHTTWATHHTNPSTIVMVFPLHEMTFYHEVSTAEEDA